MTTTTVREAAAKLARRIKACRIDPAEVDEGHRAPGDRPPAFARALMSEKPTSIQACAHLAEADWDHIQQALLHCAACDSA